MSAKILPLRRVKGEPDEMSDEALLAACALGQRAALGALFDRHYEAVRLFLFHFATSDEADIDDLVQTTFETLQKSSDRFQKRSEVRTWILGIARNVARHHLRARARRNRIAVELVNEPRPQGEILDERVFQQQRLARVKDAVASLSPKLREVFVLVYLQGLSGTEAAEVLGVREGAVWKRLHVARKQVCSILGEVG